MGVARSRRSAAGARQAGGAAGVESAPLQVSLGRRWIAAPVALLLPATMLAPWYALRVSARGLSGRHDFVQQLTGWEALSGAGVVCLLATACVCALLLTRAVSPVSGLGAAGRRAARARVDGALIAVAGLACIAALLWTSTAPPGVATGAVPVEVAGHARWGVLLALGVGALLTAVGVQVTAAAGRALRDLRRNPGLGAGHAPGQPAPGRSTNENSALSRPTIRIPSAISQRRRVM
ncbi:MAG TPA: hypothetical protein VKV21_12125 [Solirubrobacteraceae bacterium]|nr:hypothetical protein [Solirubrobacteraceae bacterium]